MYCCAACGSKDIEFSLPCWVYANDFSCDPEDDVLGDLSEIDYESGVPCTCWCPDCHEHQEWDYWYPSTRLPAIFLHTHGG